MSAAVTLPQEAPAATGDTAAPVDDSREAMVSIIEKARAEGAEPDSAVGNASLPPVDGSATAEPAPAPKEEKFSTKYIAARKAEMRAAEQRKAFRAEQEALAKERAALQAEKELAEKIRAAKDSPSELLALTGLEPKEFLEKLATEHEPQQLVARVVAAERAAREELAKKLEALEAAREQDARSFRAREIETSVQRAGDAFVNFVNNEAEKYPHILDEFAPDEAVRVALSALEETVGYDENGRPVSRSEAYRQRFGDYPDDAAIAEYLDHLAQERASKKSAWRARNGQSATHPSQGKPGENAIGRSVKAATPRTLTNGTASQKATAPKEWSQEDADQESLRILKQMYASD